MNQNALPMNESAFLDATDAIFDQIEAALDEGEFDVDINRNGNVLELAFDRGAKIIINRHSANQELWLAARSGGFHYRFSNGKWQSTRQDGFFFEQLAELVKIQTGAAPRFGG